MISSLSFFKKIDTFSNTDITKLIFGLSLFLLIIGFFVWQTSSNFTQLFPKNKPIIGVSVFPLTEIVQNIAGSQFTVVALTSNDLSPLSPNFIPPSQSRSDLELLFLLGHGFDDWANQLVSNDKQIIVDKNIQLDLPFELITSTEASSTARLLPGPDLYYWTSPVNALLIAKQITDELSVRYPEFADQIQQNHNHYSKQLVLLDTDIRRQLQPLIGVPIITIGATWKHLSRDYGFLIQAEFAKPSLEPEFSNHLTTSLNQAQRPLIFVDPYADIIQIKPIADTFSAPLVVLDPFGGNSERPTYSDTVLYNVNQLINWN